MHRSSACDAFRLAQPYNITLAVFNVVAKGFIHGMIFARFQYERVSIFFNWNSAWATALFGVWKICEAGRLPTGCA